MRNWQVRARWNYGMRPSQLKFVQPPIIVQMKNLFDETENWIPVLHEVKKRRRREANSLTRMGRGLGWSSDPLNLH